jgi:hypothetical protein
MPFAKPGSVNRTSEEEWAETDVGLLPEDYQRRALEHRLELAKERLAVDLGRASSLLRETAVTAEKSIKRGVTTGALVVGGLLLFGVVTAGITALVRRRNRRIQVRWL